MTLPAFTLERLDSTPHGTFGQIRDAEHNVLCVTLELPWRENAHEISCIPPGDYVAYRRKSPKRGYEVFELLAVPGREHIEVHIGNTISESEGCILVGMHYGTVRGQRGVLDSGTAFRHWMEANRGHDRIAFSITHPPEAI